MSPETMLYRGKADTFLRQFEARSIDLVCADPPYSESTHAKSRAAPSKGLRNPGEAGTSRKTPRARDLGFKSLDPKDAQAFAREAARVAKAWVLVFCDDALIGSWRTWLHEAGLEVVRTCPWVKPNCAPQLTGDRPGNGWEAVIIAHAKRSQNRPMKKRWNGHGHRGVFAHNVPQGKERIFSTQKPESLMIELVSLFSNPGDLVVDPFLGAGTTGVAAIRLGRRFAGSELSKKTFKLASARINAERAGLSLRASMAGQLGLFS